MSEIAKNTVTNMAEDLTMLVGYSMVNGWITEKLSAEFPPETDPVTGKQKTNYALEVLSGGASFLFMSAMMEVIRREETFVHYVFAAGEAVIMVLYARNKSMFETIGKTITKYTGIKAAKRLKLFDSHTDVTNSFVGQVYQAMQTILHGRDSSESVASTIQASNSSQDTAINREAHDLRFASLNNKAFIDSFMIKIMSGNFTQTDEIILKKVLGRENFSTVPVSIDELNSVRDFMVIKDSNGKFVGLTKGLVDLLNGLGFLKH